MKQFLANKSVVLSVIVAGAVIAVGIVAYFLMNPGSDEESGANTNDDNGPIQSSIEESTVLTTVPSAMPGVSFELLSPQRTGDTLVFNYNLVVTEEGKTYNVTDRRAGVYTIESGEDTPIGKPVSEAYTTASDGQRYGLVADEQGNQLVTRHIDTSLSTGQRVGGYFTFSLPPSGSTVSLYPGNMQAINGIKIEY